MMNSTIERVRRASSWISNPACLIDRFLDQIETLSAVFAVPTRSATLSCPEGPIEAHLGERLGA